MHSNQGSWSCEFFDSPGETVSVEHVPTPAIQERWEHAHPSHEEVDANADQIVIGEIGPYWEEPPTGEVCMPDDRAYDHEEVEDGSVVCQQQNLALTSDISEMFQPIHFETTADAQPYEKPDYSYAPNSGECLESSSNHVSQEESEPLGVREELE